MVWESQTIKTLKSVCRGGADGLVASHPVVAVLGGTRSRRGDTLQTRPGKPRCEEGGGDARWVVFARAEPLLLLFTTLSGERHREGVADKSQRDDQHKRDDRHRLPLYEKAAYDCSTDLVNAPMPEIGLGTSPIRGAAPRRS